MHRQGCSALFVVLIIAFFITPVSSQSSDPVTTFINNADSLSSVTDETALAEYVSTHSLLVGAAVGQLLDVAMQLGDTGQKDAERENLAFARRLAEIYRERTGSNALLSLVETYRGWGEAERATRRRAKDLEQQAKTAQQLGNHTAAIDSLNEARTLLESIEDARSVAIIWGSLGVAHWYTGDFEAVQKQYEQALPARRAIEDRIYEGKTLNGLGSVNYQLGRYDLALDFYQQAIDLRTKTGDIGGLGTSITYLGNTYLALGRIIDARRAFERALPLVEQSGEKAKLYEILTSVASLHADCKRMTSSNDALRRALAIARAMDDPLRQMICHNNLALNLVGSYKYGAALDELDAVKMLLAKTPDREQSVVFHRNRGITLLNMGELTQARDDLVTLLRLSRETKMPLFELEALINLGYLLRELGAYEQGLTYARQAKDLAEQLMNPNMAREATILSAEFERHLGRTDEVLAIWQRLLAQDEEAGNQSDCAVDQLGVANALAISGRREEARRIFHRMRSSFDKESSGDLALVIALGLGHSFETTNPDSARFYYEDAFQMIGQSREQIDDFERTGYLSGSRRFYFEEVARFYAEQSRLVGDPVWSDRAFRTIERAKARGLLDMMKNAALAEPSAAEEALLDSLYQFTAGSKAADERKRKVERQYRTLRRERLAATVGLFEPKGTIASPDDMQGMLPKGTVFLSYALGDTASLLWVIDQKGCKLVELAPRAAIKGEVVKLRDAMTRPGSGDKQLRQVAHTLYTMLIAPVENQIKKADRLIISPDGVLFELPFEVLLSENDQKNDQWARQPFLARDYSILYIPSASVYRSLHESTAGRAYGKELLALGDPDYSLFQNTTAPQQQLRRLPYTRREVQSIGASLKDAKRAVYIGSEANEAVLKESLKDGSFRVLHLATHGIVDPAEPATSNIVLCPDPLGAEDGHLYTMEILQLNMDVDLAVLSACESARGHVGRGEGVVGLSRALLGSGVRGIVASLWAVSDESTALLMDTFYERMLKDKRPAHRAMNEARFALMKDERFAHPYYWSPFIVIGLESTPW